MQLVYDDLTTVVRHHGRIAISMAVVTVAVWLFAQNMALSGSQIAIRYPNYCLLHPPFPVNEIVYQSAHADRFRMYRMRDARRSGVVHGKPIELVLLFIPGHHGDYAQGDVIASSASELLARSGVMIEVYALDFHEGSSAFDSNVVNDEIRFTRRCIDLIEQWHTGVDFAIIAHSMGGVVARHAIANADHVKLLVTLNTPHRSHPFLSDSWSSMFYDDVSAHGNVTLISIMGGHRDSMIPSTLGLIPDDGDSMTIFSSAIVGVHMDVDHDAGIWCAELSLQLLQSIIVSIQSQDRIQSMRAALLGSWITSLEEAEVLPDHQSSLSSQYAPSSMLDSSSSISIQGPAVVLSLLSCNQFNINSSVRLIDIPVPYLFNHEQLMARDFIRPESESRQVPRCAMIVMESSVTITMMTNHTAAPIVIGHPMRTQLNFAAKSKLLPAGTAYVVITIPTCPTTFLQDFLWEGFLPVATVLTVNRVAPPVIHNDTVWMSEVLVVSCHEPDTGEYRWHHNIDHTSQWHVHIAMHPTRSKVIMIRLMLSPVVPQYQVSVRIDPIATLSSAIRLFGGSLLLSSMMTISLYRLGGFPYPTIMSTLVLPSLAFAFTHGVTNDDNIAPGWILVLIGFWTCHSLIVVTSTLLCSLRHLAMRSSPISHILKRRYRTRRPLPIIVCLLLLELAFGPWACVTAVWIRVVVELWRPPMTSQPRIMIANICYVVCVVKCTAVLAVCKRLAMHGLWQYFRIEYLGPGIGGLFGSEFLLAAPILAHLLLILYTPGAKDHAISCIWLRSCIAISCAYSLSVGAQLYELVQCASLLSYCFLIEAWSSNVFLYRKVPS